MKVVLMNLYLTPLPSEAPKFGFFSNLPTQFSFSLPYASFRGMLVVFLLAKTLKCQRLEFSGCRVKKKTLLKKSIPHPFEKKKLPHSVFQKPHPPFWALPFGV